MYNFFSVQETKEIKKKMKNQYLMLNFLFLFFFFFLDECFFNGLIWSLVGLSYTTYDRM